MASTVASILKLLESAVALPTCDLPGPSASGDERRAAREFDPFAELTEALTARVHNSELSEQFAAHLRNEADAADERVKYGAVLRFLYEQLFAALSSARAVAGVDEYTLVSLRDLATISKSLQFAVLACIAPFLDQGVGTPLEKRSLFVKSWTKLVDDKKLQRKQLCAIATCLSELCDSNELVQTEVLGKHLGDIICIHEQLLDLGVHSLLPSYTRLLASLPQPALFRHLTTLAKQSAKPPAWFTNAIGARLSSIVASENGVAHMLNAYAEMGGESVWQNAVLVGQMGRLLVTTPKGVSQKLGSMKYWERIARQLIHGVFTRPAAGYAAVFASFCDALSSRDPAATELLLDRLLRPWEVLAEGGGGRWTRSMDTSLAVLSRLAADNALPRVIATNARFLTCAPVAWHLLACPLLSLDSPGEEMTRIRDDLYAVAAAAVRAVDNKADLLLSFVVDPSRLHDINLRAKANKLIQVVGEEEEKEESGDPCVYGAVELSTQEEGDREAALARRIQVSITAIKKLDSSIAGRVLVETLCASVGRWRSSAEGEAEGGRFVSHEETDVEWSCAAAHLLTGALFEQVSEWQVDCAHPDTAAALLRVVQSILHSVRARIEASVERRAQLDVRARESEEDRELADTAATNAKMAVGLVGAVILTGEVDDQLAAGLSAVCAEATRFADCVEKVGGGGAGAGGEQLAAAAADARRIVALLGGGGRESAPTQSASRRVVDPLEEVRADMESEEPALRGHALIRAGRMLERRHQGARRAVDEWMWTRVVELLADGDSYVFLAAVNCLAEMAYADAARLRMLVDLYAAMGAVTGEEKVETDRQVDGRNVLRGKLAEAIGKVLRLMGDLAPAYLDELIGVFLLSMRDEEETARAGALCALGDLVSACRGRGVDKHLPELLSLVEGVIRIDKSALVRRSAVALLRGLLRSAQANVIEVVGAQLRDVHRALTHLWKWDRDHVVRLHAELALEELKEAMLIAMRGAGEADGYERRIRV